MAIKYRVRVGKESVRICSQQGVFLLSEKISQSNLKWLYNSGHKSQIEQYDDKDTDGNTSQSNSNG